MLLFADNFQIYGGVTSYLTNNVYAEAPHATLVDDPDPAVTSTVIHFQGSGGNESLVRYVLETGEEDTVGLCARIWLDALPSAETQVPTVFTWRDEANAFIGTLVVTTTGRLAFRSFTGEADELITPLPVISANGWYHIEAWISLTGVGGAGHLEVRVEGRPVIDDDFVVTNSNLCAQVTMQSSVTSNFVVAPHQYMKDFVVCNGAGTHNNTFLGSVIVYDLPPVADIDLNWTPSVGSDGYSILDNAPPNDAQYLQAGNPAPDPYVCAIADLPADVTSVKGIITWVRAAKSDGGDANIQTGIISDPTGTPDTVLGQDRPITTSQTFWRDVFEEDPKTDAPWLPGAVNSAYLQLDRTA